MGSHEAIPKLEAVIGEAFPSATEPQVSDWAERIYEEYSIGAALEGIQRDDKSSGHDIDALHRAINQVGRAAKSVRSVGWHGRKALDDTVSPSQFPMFLAIEHMPVSATPLADILDSVGECLRSCVRKIPDDAPSINSAFGEGPGFGRQTTKHAAYAAKAVAVGTAEAFHELSGEVLTLRTEFNTGSSYGPFYDFLSEVFIALKIYSSVVYWARHALYMKKA